MVPNTVSYSTSNFLFAVKFPLSRFIFCPFADGSHVNDFLPINTRLAPSGMCYSAKV
jgi:hypothetical protein